MTDPVFKKIEYTIGRTGTKFYKVASFLRFFRIGMQNRYPICCAIHFSWDVGFHNRMPGVLRGSFYYPTERTFVPCRFHMRRHPTWLSHHDPEPRSQLRLFSDEIGKV